MFRHLYPSTVENSKAYLPKIIITEDTISNYLLLEFLLKNDYKLIHAPNGVEVVRLFKVASPVNPHGHKNAQNGRLRGDSGNP